MTSKATADILIDLIELDRLNAQNCIEFWGAIGSTAACSAIYENGNIYSKINESMPPLAGRFNPRVALLNSVLKFDPAEHSNANIAGILAEYRSKKLPFAWWVSDKDIKANEIRLALESEGMQLFDTLTGMAIACSVGKAGIKLPENVEIVIVENEKQLQDWILPIRAMYEMNDWEVAVHLKIYSELLQKNNNIHHFLAYLDGKPVAASTLFFGKNTAGLYNRSSIAPPVEGKNVACELMVLTELKKAYEYGYHIAVGQARPRVAKVVNRMGFVAHEQYQLYMGWLR